MVMICVAARILHHLNRHWQTCTRWHGTKQGENAAVPISLLCRERADSPEPLGHGSAVGFRSHTCRYKDVRGDQSARAEMPWLHVWSIISCVGQSGHPMYVLWKQTMRCGREAYEDGEQDIRNAWLDSTRGTNQKGSVPCNRGQYRPDIGEDTCCPSCNPDNGANVIMSVSLLRMYSSAGLMIALNTS